MMENRVDDGPDAIVVIANYLPVKRVALDLSVTSKKRLFEVFAKLIVSGEAADQELTTEQIVATLHERERLGCTALGSGIAVPHGRLAGLSEPLMALARLRAPIDFDDAEGHAIWLAVCLLVPLEKTQLHLQLLATITTKLNDKNFVKAAKNATTARALQQLLISM